MAYNSHVKTSRMPLQQKSGLHWSRVDSYRNIKIPFQGGMLTEFLRSNRYKTERLSYNQVLSTSQLMFWNK